MLDFQVFASGSSGNLYTVSDGKTKIMIEMGLPIKQIRKLLNFSLSDISFALCSHFHSDHSMSIQCVMNSGIDIYTSAGTMAALGLSGHRIHPISSGEQFTIGTWKILPFTTMHDAPDPLGFLLMNREGEKFLFATDTYFIPNRFRGLNVIAVECNYHLPYLLENIESGAVSVALKNRLLSSHFCLDNVKKFLEANDLSGVREIHLIHISKGNGDPEFFKAEIERLTGKPTFTH